MTVKTKVTKVKDTTKKDNNINKTKQKKQTNKQKNQDLFLKTYFDTLGNISDACKKCKIGRTIYYIWMKQDKEFKQRFDDIVESFDDDIETTIKSIAKSGDKDLLKFWASRKMKHRGFTEKTEVEHSGNPVQIQVNISDEVKGLIE